ncbi:MAG: L-threonylcarbamoyladenylate synthase [Gaiellaceae bacterium]|jgi:L-threonylcarbamoyladenylate synthase|nr:L-threonylcarbamoyladenylate synthase [Gaiellaceae bacterium]
MSESAVEHAVVALRAGKLAVLPTDTVYGLCATAYRSDPVARLYRLKGRPETKPTALVASDLDLLFECVPELRGRAGTIARALLPGPYTLVLPNPARRFRWLTGDTPDAIGVRVPDFEGPGHDILVQVGAIAATSANLPGGPDPRRLDDVPQEIRDGVEATVDGGELPGAVSTVLDFTGDEPRVLREGAAPVEEALDRVRGALGRA